MLFEIYLENQFLDRLLLAAKELLIGLAFGFLVSLPFYGFKYAGSLIDNYRGESSNQLPFEGHEVVTTLALAFYVTAAATFISSDGLWYMMQSFYATYALWPLETYLPPMNPAAHVLILDQFKIVFRIMIQVGLPLLGLIFLAEFLLMIGSRIARRFGLNASAFIVKNLVLLLILPTYIGLVAIIADDHVDELFTADQIFGSFLK
jgi:type III secretion protein T